MDNMEYIFNIDNINNALGNTEVIYEKVLHLFNTSLKLNIYEFIQEKKNEERKEKLAHFYIDENYLRYYNKWNKVYKNEWYFLSQIYWGDGLYSTLYFNKEGKLYIENTRHLLYSNRCCNFYQSNDALFSKNI